MTLRRSWLWVVVLVTTIGGCAWMPLKRSNPGDAVLERADGLAREGAWEDAVKAYGAYLTQYPEAETAPRVAASRDTLRALLTARAELALRRDELAVQRDELARQRDELIRLRDELVRRDQDLVRTRQESERLKADLERLKQIDLKLERRK
jgi:septal ring factor EnvC (AmiA/AmiB activator)